MQNPKTAGQTTDEYLKAKNNNRDPEIPSNGILHITYETEGF